MSPWLVGAPPELPIIVPDLAPVASQTFLRNNALTLFTESPPFWNVCVAALLELEFEFCEK